MKTEKGSHPFLCSRVFYFKVEKQDRISISLHKAWILVQYHTGVRVGGIQCMVSTLRV
jgi:hypothetical protein